MTQILTVQKCLILKELAQAVRVFDNHMREESPRSGRVAWGLTNCLASVITYKLNTWEPHVRAQGDIMHPVCIEDGGYLSEGGHELFDLA